jgi:hypothetical protein
VINLKIENINSRTMYSTSKTEVNTPGLSNDYGSSYFSKIVKERQEDGRKGPENGVLGSNTLLDRKQEILNKFPEMTEDKLEQLIKDYDIESMDSEELFKLAGKLMEDNVIPPAIQEDGLNPLFVFPKELYDAFLRGEIPMPSGVVSMASDFLYSENPYTGEKELGCPEYGLRRLQYENMMCQEAFKRFGSYYTEEEMERQVQLANSKARFLEFAQLLVDYK